MIRHSLQVSALAIMALGTVACGGGGSSSTGSVTPPATTTAPTTTAPTTIPTTTAPTIFPATFDNPVTISGSVTFDHVPFNTSTSALNFNATTQDPAPGLTVEAIDGAGTVLQRSSTDGNGSYSMAVPSNTNLRIRVKAEMLQTTGAEWDVRVVDNTSADALYALQGSLANSGTTDTTRNLNAASGLSLIHISSPRDQRGSRMPSSA